MRVKLNVGGFDQMSDGVETSRRVALFPIGSARPKLQRSDRGHGPTTRVFGGRAEGC
jgi:hypothetical protein